MLETWIGGGGDFLAFCVIIYNLLSNHLLKINFFMTINAWKIFWFSSNFKPLEMSSSQPFSGQSNLKPPKLFSSRYFIKQWENTKLLVMHWCIDDVENNSMKRLFYFCCHGIQRVCDDRQIVNMNEIVCGQQNKKDLGKLSFLIVWEGGWNEVQSCHNYGT